MSHKNQPKGPEPLPTAPKKQKKYDEGTTKLEYDHDTQKSARDKHLAAKGEKVVRHPGADSNASKNIGTLNQE
jgi:hypothetical protein